jgi:putative transposase
MAEPQPNRSKRKIPPSALSVPDNELPPVQLVEQHTVRPGDFYFERIDRAAFAAKNLYNKANFIVRQAFIFEQRYIGYGGTFHLLKQSDEYCALPRKVSNQVLIQLDHDWQAFFKAMKAWREEPAKFLGRPGLPGYKHKSQGRNLLIYEVGALGRTALKHGLIKPSQLGILIPTRQKNVNQVRIVPRKDHYVVEVVYPVIPKKAEGLRDNLVAGIDIGLNNLATLTSNKVGFRPFIVNGRPLKAINQFYNQTKARLQSLLQQGCYTSRQIIDLTNKRNRQIKHYLHVASKRLIDLLVAEGIGTLVIGQNKNWKQQLELGRQTNQNFVFIPFAQFIEMLSYKAKLVGIRVILQEESYTSKCSFLDLEPIRKKASYLGCRIKRGLFRAGDGRLINADVNGSYNIIRKAYPDAFKDDLAGLVLHPVRLILEHSHKGASKKPQTPSYSNEGGGTAVHTHHVALGLVN